MAPCGSSRRSTVTSPSLPRESDLSLVPALVETEVDDPWEAVATWARRTTTADAEERVRLLGLAGGTVPSRPPADRGGVVSTTLGRRRSPTRPWSST
ncbi:hypothetical protein [Nocardioides pacificus]